MSFAIVTDDACDINEQLLATLGFYVVYNSVIIEGREYIAGENISREEFLALLNQDIKTSTAVASVSEFQQVYQRAVDEYPAVLGIHTSSKLSGIMNAVHTTVQEFDQQIIIVDSESVSLGVTYLVELAIYLREQDLQIAEVARILNTAKSQVRILVLLGTLNFAYRGGRINSSTFFLAKFLHLKPLLVVKNGIIQKAGIGFGWRGGFAKLTRTAKHWFAPNAQPYIGIGQINKEKLTAHLKQQLLKHYGNLPVQETGLSVLIINHLGLEALAVLLAPNFSFYT